MKLLFSAIADWIRSVGQGWNDFWFAATDPALLSLMRILTGLMLFYTHLVWSFDLSAFFGPKAWITLPVLKKIRDFEHGSAGINFVWSHFNLIESVWLIWVVHILALIILLMFTLGLFSRTTAVLAWLITVSYLNRISLAEFGLDRINVMLAMYVMLGPCGARYSLDSWLRRRRGGGADEVAESSFATLAVRLIQIHMCVIYFFAGSRKLLGGVWWDGTAMWQSVANLEYQSLDMTWMAAWPLLTAFLTNLTVFFELTYPALVWPRLTRPIVLMVAVLLHLGIVLAMGMPTFGLAMLIGNAAFLSPGLVRAVIEPSYRRTLAQA
ncbi:MAG: HTTM domain-containing protein [Planctomycetes bacterium]|nr:HTTM domain-containing protein [Planctomycetota bacterium]